jgi:hypothetical protein
MCFGVIEWATVDSYNLTQDNKWRVFVNKVMKLRAILENLSDWQLLKKDSAPWS